MTLTAAEEALYRGFNTVLEPVVRAGMGSPCVISPAGLIVLEVPGRRTGQAHRVPLFALLAGGHIVAGTLRVERSQWLRNVRRSPDVRYWMGGRAHEAHAHVVMPDSSVTPADAGSARQLVEVLMPAATALGVAFVVLAPS